MGHSKIVRQWKVLNTSSSLELLPISWSVTMSTGSKIIIWHVIFKIWYSHWFTTKSRRRKLHKEIWFSQLTTKSNRDKTSWDIQTVETFKVDRNRFCLLPHHLMEFDLQDLYVIFDKCSSCDNFCESKLKALKQSQIWRYLGNVLNMSHQKENCQISHLWISHKMALM